MEDKYEIKSNSPLPEQIDIKELVYALWDSKILILTSVIFFGALAVAYSLYSPNLYRSEVLLAPVSDGAGASKIGTLANQLGGLASIAGINLGSDSSGKISEALAILQSREFLAKYVRENDILIPLFALKPVPFRRDLKIDEEIYDHVRGGWVRQVNAPYAPVPTDWEIHKEFSKLLSVKVSEDTGLVSVSIKWYDPDQACRWLTGLVARLNSKIKERDVRNAERNIEFIKNKISEVSAVGMQNVYFSLIEAQTKTIMLAEVSEEYVFRILDPAVVPLEKSEPNRVFVVLIGLLFGGMASSLVVLTRKLSSI